jgi:hypothetical protein
MTVIDSAQAEADSEGDRRFSGKYLDLEPDLRDLRRAARLAEIQVLLAIGQLGHDPSGKCVEVPDAENVELAVLAVEDVLRRAKELEALYDSAFGGQWQQA